MNNKFKKLGGEEIEDLAEYLKKYLKKYPNSSVIVGTDSEIRRFEFEYVTVVALYDMDKKDGVHYFFSRVFLPKEKDVFSKMWKEITLSVEVADYIEENLEGHIKRLSPEEIVLLKDESKKFYSPNQNKLAWIDVDINPVLGYKNKNKSNVAFKSAKEWLTSMGYRNRFKPEGWAAKTAADMIAKRKDKKRSKKIKRKKIF